MGAPKAGDRDHACRMAQSGFESLDPKTLTNHGDAVQVRCSRSSNCKKERDRGVEKTT